MHRHVTYNKFHPTFTKFGHAMLKSLRETIQKNWKQFRDIVSDNFRIISDENCGLWSSLGIKCQKATIYDW